MGGVAEWSKATVLKTVEGATPPRVRIPPPPQLSKIEEVTPGEVAELVEGDGLLNRCTAVKAVPRVRIPPSPQRSRRRKRVGSRRACPAEPERGRFGTL
jgi:hypothetical protein